MKTFWIGFFCALCLTLAVAATVRETLYQHFGPKLIEAIVLTCQDEFNRNRQWHGQPQITTNAMIEVITNKLANVPDYSWMEKP